MGESGRSRKGREVSNYLDGREWQGRVPGRARSEGTVRSEEVVVAADVVIPCRMSRYVWWRIGPVGGEAWVVGGDRGSTRTGSTAGEEKSG